MTAWDEFPAPPSATAASRVEPAQADGSCYLHRDHGQAIPLYLDTHYILPEAWQRELWGEVLDRRKVACCQTGTAVLAKLLNNMWGALHDPNRDYREVAGSAARRRFSAEVRLAEEGVQRYMVAAGMKAEGRASGPRSTAPEKWRCGRCGGGMVLIKDTWSHRCTASPLLKRIPGEDA